MSIQAAHRGKTVAALDTRANFNYNKFLLAENAKMQIVVAECQVADLDMLAKVHALIHLDTGVIVVDVADKAYLLHVLARLGTVHTLILEELGMLVQSLRQIRYHEPLLVHSLDGFAVLDIMHWLTLYVLLEEQIHKASRV